MRKKVAIGPKTDGSCDSETIPDPQTQCRLFSLPPELRNEIYTLVFALPPNNYGRVRLTKLRRHDPDKPTVLSILKTCRLIRNEAEDLFYNKHNLEFGNFSCGVDDIERFLKSTKAYRLAAIRTLTVLVADIECITRIFRKSRPLVGLTSLSILVCAPRGTYYTRSVEREMPLVKKAVQYLPVSLSRFKLREIGVGRYGRHPEDEIVTDITLEVEVTVMASIASRKDFNGVISDLNRCGVQT